MKMMIIVVEKNDDQWIEWIGHTLHIMHKTIFVRHNNKSSMDDHRWPRTNDNDGGHMIVAIINDPINVFDDILFFSCLSTTLLTHHQTLN